MKIHNVYRTVQIRRTIEYTNMFGNSCAMSSDGSTIIASDPIGLIDHIVVEDTKDDVGTTIKLDSTDFLADSTSAYAAILNVGNGVITYWSLIQYEKKPDTTEITVKTLQQIPANHAGIFEKGSLVTRFPLFAGGVISTLNNNLQQKIIYFPTDESSLITSFGQSIDINSAGNRVVVGSPSLSSQYSNQGRVFVYEYNDGKNQWEKLGNTIVEDSTTPYYFEQGISVRINDEGNRIAVASAKDNAENKGVVSVYEYNENTTQWAQLGQSIPGETKNDESGSALDINGDGNRIAVGSYRNQADLSFNVGHVRVYDLNGSTWTLVGGEIDGDEDGQRFGHSVALNKSGNRLVVGATYDEFSNESGYAKVYDYSENTTPPWTLVGEIQGENVHDKSGFAVDINDTGNIIAVGSIYYDDSTNADDNHGVVRVWECIESKENNTKQWIQLGSDIVGRQPGDNAGWSLYLSGDGTKLTVGFPSEGDNSRGYISVYQLVNGEWEIDTVRSKYVPPSISGFNISPPVNGMGYLDVSKGITFH